jgi:predicted ATPase
LVCFERHREALQRELGIAPSPATRRLVDGLRAAPGRMDPAAPAARNLPAGAPPCWEPGRPFPLPPRLRLPQAAPFVGRAGELGALRRAWRDACDGLGPLLVVVGGEAGIGKSRLARELAMRVRPAPAVVLQGSAQEDAIASLQPVVEAVGHLTRVAAPGLLSQILGARAGDLARLIPDLPAAPDAESGDIGARRFRMVDAVAELLAGVSAHTPVLLVLDDLHWSDAATSSLLRHVLESRPGARVLAVATCREVAVPPGGHLAEVLQRLGRAGLLRRVVLPGIDDADTAAMARGLIGREVPPELLALVHREAGGNPFFVQELVRHLGETGSSGLLALLRSEVPAAAREVIRHRLARLGDDCRRLLTIGAVVGREFEVLLLEQISPLPADALVHRTMRDRLTRAHRRRLHARIADALSDAGAALRDVAHHLCEAGPAGDVDAAVDVAERAADQALRSLAHAEAMELYIRAMALLPADDPRRTDDLVDVVDDVAAEQHGMLVHAVALEGPVRAVADVAVLPLDVGEPFDADQL